MTDQIVVGLASWIILDTNYPDFKSGSEAAFALVFSPKKPLEDIAPHAAVAPSRIHRGSGVYGIIAQVVHVAEDWWVIDAGVLAFQDSSPPVDAKPGAWLRGEIQIDIDPYDYFEHWGHQPGVPALIYEWRIDKIEVQTAPYVEISPRKFALDATKLGWREVAETKAFEDPAGEYLLHCTRLNGPRWPRSKRLP
ncbi:hypothetical protein SSBR45G_25830 [Bradyrhizobium sp. SSBR45G]|nr:hypothetical protein SSBR45G_25830 [Bradyrhizobium sp. SSBR45G]GLH84912.1 hypothetical protein SSBR45R_23720 [Bradyrhizobium sp. SSBR45R]